MALRIPATVKGETGWLVLRLGGEGFEVVRRYAVTMDPAAATDFRTPNIAARHVLGARRAGIEAGTPEETT